MNSLMKEIDTALQVQVDKFKDNENYVKLTDNFSHLEEKEQRIINALIVLILFSIPLLILYLINSGNNTLRTELEMKRQLVEVADGLIKSKASLQTEERNYLGSELITTESQLKTKISGLLNIAGIEGSKVMISNIEEIPEVNLLTKMKADMKFEDLDNKDFFNLIQTLSSRLKIKIDQIKVEKNKETNLLNGLMSIQYLSKAPSDER